MYHTLPWRNAAPGPPGDHTSTRECRQYNHTNRLGQRCERWKWEARSLAAGGHTPARESASNTTVQTNNSWITKAMNALSQASYQGVTASHPAIAKANYILLETYSLEYVEFGIWNVD